jgi:pimeloyl-ACP methyl ester carboxylesterase
MKVSTVSSRTVSANGLDMFLLEAGTGPLVLLCHGWPELSHSWRHQLPALAAAGFRVVAPDMRGFGRTSTPNEIEAYTIFHLVGDVVALVSALGEQNAIIIGHDWGAAVAWHAAMFRPDVFTAVAGLSVPPPWRAHSPPLATLGARGNGTFYWQYFQAIGAAESELERDVALTMSTVFSPGFLDGANPAVFVDPEKGFLGDQAGQRKKPEWISDGEFSEFVGAFKRTGFQGGLNWYRNIDRNWELTAPWQYGKIHQPSLFLAGAADAVVGATMGEKRVASMHNVLTNLTAKILLPEAGHWIQQERPAEVNAALINFLTHLK